MKEAYRDQMLKSNIEKMEKEREERNIRHSEALKRVEEMDKKVKYTIIIENE